MRALARGVIAVLLLAGAPAAHAGDAEDDAEPAEVEE